MKKHAQVSGLRQAVTERSTPGSKAFRLKREIFGALAIGAVLIASLGLSSCTGITSAGGKGANSGTPGTGVLSPNSSGLNFGNVAVGSKMSQSVTVTNTGTAAVDISQATVSGAGFTVMAGNSPSNLGVGQTAAVQVQFAPQSAGAATGSLNVTSNVPNTPLMVSLTGTGTQGSLSANPASVNFGSVIVGSNGSASITLSNPGSAAVSITAATVTGTGYTMTGLAPETLNPGQTSSFTTTFTPTSTGSPSGTISIVTNAPGSPLQISLSGSATATQAQLSVSPSSVAFNNVAVGSSATQNVTLTNTGNAALNITAAGISGTGYTTTLTAPMTINAGANRIVTVTYTPTLEGSTPGSLSLTSNAPSTPAAIALSGTGLESIPAASPSSATFSNVSVGNSNSQPILVRNNGNAALTFSQINVTGAGFSVTGISTSTTIAPGGSTTLNAVFTPSSGGTVSGTVSLTTNGSPSQVTITLSGTGAAATHFLSVNPAALNFGTIPPGQSSSLPATVTNTGNSNITISSVTVTGTGFSGTGIGSGLILTPGQTATLTVQFTPSGTGSDSGSANINSNATNSAGATLSGSSHSVGLSWSASASSVSGYNVYRALSSGAYGSTPLNSTPVAAVAYTDPMVSGGQTYYYVVRSVESGVESVNSGETQAVVPTP